MSNLEKIDNALMELEGIDFESLNEELQNMFIDVHSSLMHLSIILEQMESGY